jgi:hypothetical protein
VTLLLLLRRQVMMLVNFIPDVAIIDPITSVLPLVFVIGVTAIKQAYEDYKVGQGRLHPFGPAARVRR